MRRSQVNTYATFTLLIIIFAVSSFSYIPSSFHKISNTINDYLIFSAPAYIKYAVDKANDTESDVPEPISFGPEDAIIEIHSPEILPAGETLICSVTVININPGREGLLTWYVDGEIISEENVTTGTYLPGLKHDFEYVIDMPETAHIKAVLRYISDNGIQEISSENTVTLSNHDKEHWTRLEAARVIALVSPIYEGNYTLEWALENDYTAFEKEVWINSVEGMESKTEYLIWVNRSHQRVNIFQGSEGNWELIKEFVVATGGRGTATLRGTTHIPSRTRAGWGFETFRVAPVVRFFPGTGYAFHSRPKDLGSGRITDESIGFPVSAGCIRMYDEDIWYIYDNIPDLTTVVVH